jgi:hypothetical protein
MATALRSTIAQDLPPLVLATTSVYRIRQTDPRPCLARSLCVVVALALPALGLALADTVRRVGGSRAPQAAAPVNPSGGAAASHGHMTPAQAVRATRTTVRDAQSEEV